MWPSGQSPKSPPIISVPHLFLCRAVNSLSTVPVLSRTVNRLCTSLLKRSVTSPHNRVTLSDILLTFPKAEPFM